MFNELLHGETDEVLCLLDTNTLDETELRAALTNAFKRISYLEKQIAQIRTAMKITHQPKSR